jgi:hypothetical protein
VKIRVECEHGTLARVLDDAEQDTGRYLVDVRALILACPDCARKAQASIEAPGR